MIDLLILLIAAVIADGTGNRREASIEETEYFAEVVAQPNWQITIKEAEFLLQNDRSLFQNWLLQDNRLQVRLFRISMLPLGKYLHGYQRSKC